MTPARSSTASPGPNERAAVSGRHLVRVAGSALSWLPAACVALPLLVVAWRALGGGGLAWERLVQYRLWDQLGSTALLLLLVVSLASAIGVACAWLISAHEFSGRRHFEWLLILPLGVPGFVAGAAYLDGLEQAVPLFLWIREHFGMETFLWSQRALPWCGAVLVLVVTLYPYVYLSCRAVFARQQADLIEAARTLGCGEARAFGRIILPLARPAIAAGAVLVAMETANDYGVVSLFGLTTLTPGIFRAWSEGSPEAAMRLALVLLSLMALVLFAERAQRGRRDYVGDTRQQPLARRPLGPKSTVLAWSLCGLPLLLGFFWPVFRFLRWAVSARETTDWAGYAGALFNSSWLALLCCVLVVGTAFWLTAGRRAYRLPGGHAVTALASLGYAVPAALLAVGIGALVSTLARGPGLSWLALSATATGLVFACWVRFMAVGIQPLSAGQTRLATDLHDAARTLGRPPAATLLRIDARLLLPALAAATLLCFVDVFKELTLTLVMRPFDFETLATLTFRLTSEGRIPEASVPALVLVGGGMLGVAVLYRLLQSRQ